MNRGILIITNDEYINLMSTFHIDNYKDTPLYNKLLSIQQLPRQGSYELLLSSDELETILDDIGFVSIESNPILNGLILKITNILNKFQN